ncbi:hypothetical protein CROQUDRAFT_234450 [Cronartium quercuum f. sp. fusiforme G11]|uniref:Uncharacterized protein n=1 Tax=Cronartium quercuum f. sp. fusiforme G11 TaxID=708437 RepID=A0A9P6NBA8_9BASI|nr:hypothetical protein CROQUDRAFT_234450 [Cronartium quercuum f. sp. fusiforme G11]
MFRCVGLQCSLSSVFICFFFVCFLISLLTLKKIILILLSSHLKPGQVCLVPCPLGPSYLLDLSDLLAHRFCVYPTLFIVFLQTLAEKPMQLVKLATRFRKK